MCNKDNSPNTSLPPFCLNSIEIQMNSKLLGILNHHMNLQHLAPCQVWKSYDKEKLHDDYKNFFSVVTLVSLARPTLGRALFCGPSRCKPSQEFCKLMSGYGLD